MVGFDTKMHQQMDKFYKDKETVTISNCEIRPSKVDDELEIIVKSSSGLQRSPTKFQNPDDITGLYSIQCITIEHVEELPIFKKISITAKAVLVSDQEQVYNGKVKQDVKLADTTGSICLVLWESDVGKLQQGISYCFSGLVVRNKNYISMHQDVTYEIVDDLNDIESDDDTADPEKKQFEHASVVAVVQLDINRACLSCKRKVDESSSAVLGRCTQCSTLQRLDKCQRNLHAVLLVEFQGTTPEDFQAFGDTLVQIADTDDVTD